MEIKKRIELNKLLPANPVTVELGVAEGLFSRDILERWKPAKHYLVDMWESHPEFKGDAGFEQTWHNKNFANVKELMKPFQNAELLRGSTVSMANKLKHNSVDLVYVDACHAYECVMNDIKAWWPKLKVGGIMAFHDYENNDYGVNQAVKEFASLHSIKINSIPENRWEDAGAWIKKLK